MCKSAAQGGKRCAAHTGARLLRATEALRRANYAADPAEFMRAEQRWETAAAHYAATDTGKAVLTQQRDAAAQSGDHTAYAMLTTALQRGSNLQAVNQHVAAMTPPLQPRLYTPGASQMRQATHAAEKVQDAMQIEHLKSVARQRDRAHEWAEGSDGVNYAPPHGHTTFEADVHAAEERVRQAAQTGTSPLTYRTDSHVTDGLGARDGGRGFGVEIEFALPEGLTKQEYQHRRNLIGADLHRAGLTSSPTFGPRPLGTEDAHQGGWEYVLDDTAAGEIVSPVMHDEPETWHNLATVCDIVRRHGGVATTSVGTHVNVSAADFAGNVHHHNRLLRMTNEFEDTLYRLGSNPDTQTHRAVTGNDFAMPNPPVPKPDGYARISDAVLTNHRTRGKHIPAVNLSHMGTSTPMLDRIEYRLWDASLRPEVIQQQIKMSLALTEAAVRETGYVHRKPAPVGSHARQTTGVLRRHRAPSTENVRRFADLLYRRHDDKKELVTLFAWTRWQPRITTH